MEVKIISTEALEQLMRDHPRLFLIDVRRPEEIKDYGSIEEKAKNVPVQEIESAFALSPEDFEQTYQFPKPSVNDEIVVYCRTGSRSHMAAEFLLGNGFLDVRNYKDSVQGWAAKHPDGKVRMY